MDPRGAQPAGRVVPRSLRGPEPVPPGEPRPGFPLESVRAALCGDGEGSRVRGRHGRTMDASRVSAGPPAPPRARHPVLDGQDLAFRVRRERTCGTLPDAERWHPSLAGGLHRRTPRLQRGRLEAETGPRAVVERRAPGGRNPPEFEAVRRRPKEDAPPPMRGDHDRFSGSTRRDPHLRGGDCRPDRIDRNPVRPTRRTLIRPGPVTRRLRVTETEGRAPP